MLDDKSEVITMKTSPPLLRVCMLFGCCQVNPVLVSFSHGGEQSLKQYSACSASATEPCQASKWFTKKKAKKSRLPAD